MLHLLQKKVKGCICGKKKISAVFYTRLLPQRSLYSPTTKKKLCASSIYDFRWYFDFKKCIAKSTSYKLGVEQMLVINFGVLDQDEVNIFFDAAKHNNITYVSDFFSLAYFNDN